MELEIFKKRLIAKILKLSFYLILFLIGMSFIYLACGIEFFGGLGVGVSIMYIIVWMEGCNLIDEIEEG